MNQVTLVMDKLRAETHDHHTRVEALPFFAALAAGELPLESYVGLLRALAIVYSDFEHTIMQVNNPVIVGVWDEHMRKLLLIERDLAFFETRLIPDIPAAALRALILSEQIRRRASQDPVSLLGYLYVLEGSTLGGMILRSQVARHFQLSHSHGVAYLSSYDKGTKAHWKNFVDRMNQAIGDVVQQERIVVAAGEAFTGIEHIIRALYPIRSQKLPDLVTALNPGAGHHPIPSDLREIQAALRAGERSWQQFPYYEWRYGARGQEFTRSDSAWIVTLTEHNQAVVNKQITWLGRLLSSRGMPQWMLERHLEVLHDELVKVVPEKREAYDKLLNGAQLLADLRRKQISDEVFEALSLEFERQVGLEWSNRLKGIGRLLVAAVADEKSGIENAVTSLETWLTDPSRFPNTWIKAVRMTIRTARARATRVQ